MSNLLGPDAVAFYEIEGGERGENSRTEETCNVSNM